MRFFLQPKAYLIALAASLFGCVGDDSNTEPALSDSFDFTAMFANYVDNIIIPNYQAVQQAAAALAAEGGPLEQYCAGIATSNSFSLYDEAFAGWQNLQTAIQISESHVVGPAADNAGALRSRLNSFHSGALSTCGIDQAVVLFANTNDFDVTSRTVTQRGIGAVEYLLYNSELSHTCPSQISETADWNSRDALERQLLRCEYAVALVEDIESAATTLASAWRADGANYRSEFINPLNISESLSALSDAMFFIEAEVKDVKLGIPTGISDTCPDLACPDAVESPYTGTSITNIANNIHGFSTMLTGADGLGFDDIIAEAGVGDLNERFLSYISQALQSVDNQVESLFTQASAINSSQAETSCTNAFTNPESGSDFPACSLYGFVKRITDELKVGFVAAVDVDLPDRSQSDND